MNNVDNIIDELANAIKNEDHDKIDSILNSGVNLKKYDKSGDTILATACYCGNLDLVKKLIEKGASPFQLSQDNSSLLAFASTNGHLDILKYLIETYKLNVNLISESGTAPLLNSLWSNSYDTVKYLIDKGANIDVKEEIAGGVLHYVAKYKVSVDILNLLILHGASVESKDFYSKTPLVRACEEGRIDIIEALLDAKADINIVYSGGHYNCIFACLDNDRDDVLRLLIKRGIDYKTQLGNNTNLQEAYDYGAIKCFKILLENGCKLDEKNKAGLSTYDFIDQYKDNSQYDEFVKLIANPNAIN